MLLFYSLWFATLRSRRQRRRLLLQKKKSAIRMRNYLTFASLKPCKDCPWVKLWETGDDKSLISVFSLTRESILKLHNKFKFNFIKHNPTKGGRPRKLSSLGSLLCLLQYYSDSLGNKSLCQLYGLPPSTLSELLQRGEKALLDTLSQMKEASIKWPNLEQQRHWGELVQHKNELVEGRWGFIDGKNYRVQSPSNSDLQNAMYNGWLHSTLITGTICFGVDGTIVWAKHNFPGSWNDGETSRPFQLKLCRDDINLPGHGVLSDSAFPVCGDMFGRIVTPLKDGDIDLLHRQKMSQ
jgi:hypothetical protein